MKILTQNQTKVNRRGFSLIELLVAMGILSVLMLMMTVLLDQVQRSWRFSESRISQFREARVAFDLMAKNIGQATLNTYWDLKDEDKDGLYDGYFRTSELHFITVDGASLPGGPTQRPLGHAVFFQAPLGFSTNYRNLNNLFNGRGYFVSFGDDSDFIPSFAREKTTRRNRFRMMEFRPPAESNQVFQDGMDERATSSPQIFDQWFRQGLGVGDGNFTDHLNPLAENILTLIISPRDTLSNAGDSRGETYSLIAPGYSYDSNDPSEDFEAFSQQVPPLIRLTVIAIDEETAARFDSGASLPPELDLSSYFQRTENFDADLKEISEAFGDSNINYKVFSTVVMLRSSKWST